MPSDGDRKATDLLEREDELAELAEAFGRARTGRGSVIAIDSVPGLGRSSLLEAASAIAEREGMELLTATCRPSEVEFPFGAALQLFEGLLAKADSVERAGLLSEAAQRAAPLFAGETREGLGEDETFSLLRGLYWLCANLAGRRPVAICIDDLHWCDEPTLRFILYLSQRLDDVGVSLVLARSTAERGPGHDVVSEITAAPGARRIELRPLSSEAVATLIRARLSPNTPLATCRAGFEITNGNPQLLDELLTELETPSAKGARLSARRVRELGPASVAHRVEGRLRRMGLPAPELARAVAVLGHEVELRHAARLAGIEQGEAAVIADALVDGDVLERAERLTFSHPIVRNALYAALAPVDRAEAHLRAARMLMDESARVQAIATHLTSARRGGAQWAVDALTAAARRELAEGEPRAAVAHLQRALVEPPDRDRRAQVILELGRAEAIAGEPGAVERLTQALDLMGDPGERARTLLEVGRTLYAQGRHRDAAGAFRRGISELKGGDGTLRAQLQVAFAAAARSELLHEGADSMRVPLTVKGGDTRARRVLLAHSAFELALRGEPVSQVRQAAETALGGGALLEDETSDGVAYYLACVALTIAEGLDAAESALNAAAHDARERGSEVGLATASYFRGHVALGRGRLNDAARDARIALAAERYGWHLAKAGAHALLLHVAIEIGDMDSAGRELALGERELDAAGPFSHSAFLAGRARWLMERNQPREALSDLLECGRLLEEAEATNPAVLPWRELAAVAAWQDGDRRQAVEIAEESLGLARDFAAPGAIGGALKALGIVRGGRKGAEHLEEAVDALEDSQLVLERARALVELGAALRRVGRLRAARDPLRRGVDLANRCGARALAERGLTEVAAAGGRPRRTALSGLEALTPRERQVAELAAQGMSNRKIAQTLFVTLKTVELHLTKTYRKLDLGNRRELPARLADGDAQRSGGS